MWGPWDWQMMPLSSTADKMVWEMELRENCHLLLEKCGHIKCGHIGPLIILLEVGRRAFWAQSPARAGYRGAGEGRGPGVEGACDFCTPCRPNR